jgi:hypothetical protein
MRMFDCTIASMCVVENYCDRVKSLHKVVEEEWHGLKIVVDGD